MGALDQLIYGMASPGLLLEGGLESELDSNTSKQARATAYMSQGGDLTRPPIGGRVCEWTGLQLWPGGGRRGGERCKQG